MAEANAQVLKNRGIMIYIIGLGSDVNKVVLGNIASGPTFEYYAPDSSDLQSIFDAIAKDIKLRLTQ
jgi:hypothetical protein